MNPSLSSSSPVNRDVFKSYITRPFNADKSMIIVKTNFIDNKRHVPANDSEIQPWTNKTSYIDNKLPSDSFIPPNKRLLSISADHVFI